MPEKYNDDSIGNGNLQPYIVPSGYFAERDLINENIKSRKHHLHHSANRSEDLETRHILQVNYLDLFAANILRHRFYRNEVSGGRHSILQENSYVRLFPDGHVLTSIRLTKQVVHHIVQFLVNQINAWSSLPNEPEKLPL